MQFKDGLQYLLCNTLQGDNYHKDICQIIQHLLFKGTKFNKLFFKNFATFNPYPIGGMQHSLHCRAEWVLLSCTGPPHSRPCAPSVREYTPCDWPPSGHSLYSLPCCQNHYNHTSIVLVSLHIRQAFFYVRNKGQGKYSWKFEKFNSVFATVIDK